MLARTREATDTENDTHLSDAEIYKHLTSSVADTWDKIQMHGLGGEAVKWATFSTVANQQEYSLSASIWAIQGAAATALTDFYQVKTLYVSEGNGQFRPISRVTPSEEHGMRAPLGVYSMKLYYVPCAPVFTTGAESFDGINGWEEHTIMGAAIRIKAKKEDDTGPYRAAMREVEERMKKMANRNQDEAPRIIKRARATRASLIYAPYSSNVTGWDIRGNNIELFYNYGVYI
jgi:hypothetical protein